MTPLSNEHKVLIAALACQMAVTAMDNLQGTYAYRQEVKQQGNKFLKELEKYTGQVIPLIFGVQDETMYQLMNSQEAIINQLVTLRPEDIEVISALIDQYKQSPETTLEYLQIQFTDKI